MNALKLNRPVLELVEAKTEEERLDEVVRELLRIKAQISDLKAEADKLTDQIKDAMVDAGAEVIEGDSWKASWKNVNSSQIDTKKLKAEQAELAARYTKTKTTTRFVVSWKKGVASHA